MGYTGKHVSRISGLRSDIIFTAEVQGIVSYRGVRWMDAIVGVINELQRRAEWILHQGESGIIYGDTRQIESIKQN